MTDGITLKGDSVVVEGNISTGTNTASQMSDKLESLLSEVLPDLDQLVQQYDVSKALAIHLVDLDQSPNPSESLIATCCVHNRILRCHCTVVYGATHGVTRPSDNSGLEMGLKPEKVQPFCTDIASKLSTILPSLSESARQADGSFEIHLLINPAVENSEQPMVCQRVGNTPQGSIFQCARA